LKIAFLPDDAQTQRLEAVNNISLMKKNKQQYFTNEKAIIIYLIAVKVIFHLVLPEYGFFRDELYYISIGDQFNFSNLDMLPLSPLYLKFFTFIFGYSIKTVHLASSLLGAGSLLFTCLITKELGGGKYAVLLSGIFILFSGFTIFGSLFTYDSIDFLVNVTVLYLLVKLFKTNKQKLWYYIGFVLGLGLLNKLTTLFFGSAIFVSLWLVSKRKMFKTKQVWIAGIIALLFLLPYLIWQSQNDWYFLEFAANYSGGLSYLASFPEFIWNQIIPNNIVSLPIWLTGLYLLLFSSRWKKYRFFGIMYLFLFLLYYKIGAKFYFLIPMYTILLSVGSIKLEEKFNFSRNFKIAIPLLYIILSLPFLPMQVPLLPVDDLINYANVLSVDAGVKYENNSISKLPQHFADRFGWEELVIEISKEYHSISTENKLKIGILTNNYGIASAVHFYRDKYNLPEPIANVGWFYFESIRKDNVANTYVCIGFSKETLCHIFNSVIEKRVFTHQYCMPHENNRPIYLSTNPKVDVTQYFRIERKIDSEFLSIIKNDGINKAIEFYKKQKANNDKTILFTENQINLLGYENLRNNLIDEAILIFRFNVEEFPESSNVYDSLGEAYMKANNFDLAVHYYKKSLELNFKNHNAKHKLNELYKMISERDIDKK
jgi:hypothetical protein